MKQKIDDIAEKIEEIMEWGGTGKDITLLVISAVALLISIFHLIPGLPFDAAWVAIVLCGIPIIMEAVIGLVTAFDIKADAFEMKPGQGVCAVVSGKEVLAGNEKLMTAAGVTVDSSVKAQMEAELLKGCTVTLVAVNGKLAGLLALSDSLREESKSVIHGLQRLGVTPVLLTGDNEYSAGQIAGQIGIQDVHANCLPEDKLNFIDAYQKQEEPVCMIGDGVNDAPALKKAMIGIAMGGVGSDIAVDAADIALVDDEIKELPHLFALSGKMMNKIKFNLSFSMLLNFVAIILAMTGILNPVVGALVHNCGSVFVIINSAFLMSYAYRNI